MKKKIDKEDFNRIQDKVKEMNKLSDEINKEFGSTFFYKDFKENVVDYNHASKTRLRKKLSKIKELITDIRNDLRFINKEERER